MKQTSVLSEELFPQQDVLWSCPKCRREHKQADIPKEYRCFCKKMVCPLRTGKSYKRPAWIFRLVFNKNPSWNGANSVKTILGLSVQGGNRCGSTLVQSNKNHVEVIIIFILQHGFCLTQPWVEQHGLYTIPILDVQSQDGFYAIRTVFVKNQPKKIQAGRL